MASVAGAALHVIGLGVRRVPAVEPGSVVVLAGLAGGLDPSLGVGDLVLDTPFGGNPPLEGPWRVGAIHTTSSLISTAPDKACLFRQTGALAVDMEQAIVRRTLPAPVTVIGLRAISDPAGMAIDPAVVRLVDEVGRPRPLAIAAALVRRPGLVPHLRDLRANARRALGTLAAAMPALLAIVQRTFDDPSAPDPDRRAGSAT